MNQPVKPLSAEELVVLPRMRLDIEAGRYDLIQSADVLVLLDIIDRLDRAARVAAPSDGLREALERIAALRPKGPFVIVTDELAEAQGIARDALATAGQPDTYPATTESGDYWQTTSVSLTQPEDTRTTPEATAPSEAGLDVERLRTADANVSEGNPFGPYRFEPAYWHLVAAEYARLTASGVSRTEQYEDPDHA